MVLVAYAGLESPASALRNTGIYVIYRYLSIYIGTQCGSATRLTFFDLLFHCMQQSMRSGYDSESGSECFSIDSVGSWKRQ